MTLQKDLGELDRALKSLKAETVDKFGVWYFRSFGRFAFPLHIFLSIVAMTYIIVAYYYTINQL